MNIIWTLRSQENLHSIVEYVSKDDPTAGQHLSDTIIDSVVAMLTDHPMSGRVGRVEKTREWIAHKRYIVVYSVDRGNVKIITVRHTSIKWPNKF